VINLNILLAAGFKFCFTLCTLLRIHHVSYFFLVCGENEAYVAIADAVLCSFWIVLATVGVVVQCYKQQGRAPFPPPPNTRHREYFRRRRFPCASQASREQAPLLVEADIPPARIPCITTSRCNDDVFESPQHSSCVFRFFKR
jgi:hypothetical protein